MTLTLTTSTSPERAGAPALHVGQAADGAAGRSRDPPRKQHGQLYMYLEGSTRGGSAATVKPADETCIRLVKLAFLTL